MKKSVILTICIIAGLTICLISVCFAVIASFGYFDKEEEIAAGPMNRYFAICTGTQTDGWNDIKTRLQETAGENGAAVEFLEEGFNDDRADASCIEMAVDSGADGIIIYAHDDDLDAELDYAAENDVPVVFVVEGYVHDKISEIVTDPMKLAENMIDYIKKTGTESRNTVIISSSSLSGYKIAEINSLFAKNGYDVTVSTFSGPYVFEAKETVKELLAAESNIDMICCLDSVATLGVAQSMVELNKVNVITVIGCGKSTEILNMIQKNIVKASFEVDYEKIADEAMDILVKNSKKPFVYESRMVTDIRVIDSSNVSGYIAEDGE